MLTPFWENIVLLATLTLLPLVPSFLLFKLLPSDAKVSGPLKGLRLNLGGAFAGYFALFLALWYFSPAICGSRYDVWRISGSVAFEPEGSNPNTNDVQCNVSPPSLRIEADRSFHWDVPVERKPDGTVVLPNVRLDLKGYEPVVVHLLAEGEKTPVGIKPIKQTRVEKPQGISLDEPVVLKVAAPYPY